MGLDQGYDRKEQAEEGKEGCSKCRSKRVFVATRKSNVNFMFENKKYAERGKGNYGCMKTSVLFGG